MYEQIELYNGTRVDMKISDRIRLEGILDKMSSIIKNGGGITSQTNIQTLTYKAGIATGNLFREEDLPMEGPPGFCDNQIHPTRSLGLYGIGGLYAGIESATDDQRAVFLDTKRYFREAFLLQEALFIERTRDEPNEEYMAQLNSSLEEMGEKYSGEITKQTDAFDELAKWLSDPTRN